MRIGQLVKTYAKKIFFHCDSIEHNEILSLLDSVYSKEKFGIRFPFCAEVENIGASDSKRYWTEVYLVRGKQVRVTSQWYESSRPLFVQYLKLKNIEFRSDLQGKRKKTIEKMCYVARPAARTVSM